MINKAHQVELVPWDHTSEEHYKRMVQQRIDCGWMSDAVAAWKETSAKGTKIMFWVLLAEDYPGRDEQLAKHKEKYPEEATHILDTASTLWGSPREATLRHMLPIGHVGLGLRPDTNKEFGLPSKTGWIGPLYVSWTLQGLGLGRATMLAAESMMSQPPLEAKVSALDAITEDCQFCPAVLNTAYLPLGNRPAVSNEAWYRKQGYEEIGVKKDVFTSVDPKTGEKTPLSAIYFKKSLSA